MLSGNVVGSYRVIEQIGEGGMGSVWIAEHTMLGRRAALKILHPNLCAQLDFVRRFFNEARAATAIGDPGIVQIFDFGYDDEGSAYIVMELLHGEGLEQRIARGPLKLTDALRLMRQTASTLGEAHARGIIHRDLKPANIFIAKDPEVPGGERAKVLDFGIAKLVDDHKTGVYNINAPALAATGVIGTPLYMSPEQCDAQPVDARSDVYALGCVLFELLTGRPPFDAESEYSLAIAHINDPAPAPSRFVPSLPKEIDDIVLRCLAKDPADRFSSAAELAAVLNELVALSGDASASGRAATSQPHLGRRPTSSDGQPEIDDVRATPPAPTRFDTDSRADAERHVFASATGTPARASSLSRGRVAWIVGLASIVAGVAIASVTSHRSKQPVPAAAPVAEPAPPTAVGSASGDSPASAAIAVPAASIAPDAADLHAPLRAQMAEALQRFVAWAPDHAGAPCPTLRDLELEAVDAWGYPLTVTCTDQPHNQIIGLVSAGPDGAARTADDIGSWELGSSLTELVRGERWRSAPPAPPVAASRTPASDRPPASKKPKRGRVKPAPVKPVKPEVVLDKYGVPVHR
jgi:eukaryotic-like serine/threonine-protein kinase